MSNDDLLNNFRSGAPQFRQSPFGNTGGDQLLADLGGGINPSGFVSNVDNEPANVIIDDTGIQVTDGAISVLNSGGGAFIGDGTLQNSTADVVINAAGITILDGALTVRNAGGNPTVTGGEVVGGISGSQLSGTIPAGVALGIAQTTVTSSGVKVNDGVDDRVILGAIDGGDYGLKVVSSDGATVIIDGTSNVFKILTTGTTSHTASAGADTSTDVTLTALGTFASTPAHLSFVSDTNTASSARRIGRYIASAKVWASPSSGGSPVQEIRAIDWGIAISDRLNGSSECVVSIAVNNSTTISRTGYGRYYILKEVAL